MSLDPAELYLTYGRGESLHRPLFTADVYESPDGRRLLVAEHPCAMRKGVSLADSVLVAPVATHQVVPLEKWRTGYYDRFPLPAPDADRSIDVAQLGRLERCQTSELRPERRMSCMSPIGVNLFRQRLIWHLTRFLVPAKHLEDAFGCYYHEADIIEDCLDLASAAGADVDEAARAIDDALSEPAGNAQGAHGEDPPSFRDLLRDPQRRPYVRRSMRVWAQDRYTAPGQPG